MYCAQCGNQVPEEVKFCNACGHAMPQTGGATTGTATQTLPNPNTFSAGGGSSGSGSIGSGSAGGGSAGGGSIGGGRKRKGLLVVAVVAAVVILAGVVAFANMWRLMPDKAYYGYLEYKNKPISFNKLYKDITKASEIKPFSKEIELTISDAGGLGNLPVGVDPQAISITTQIDYSKNKTTGYLSLNFEDNALLDALLYRDKDMLGFGLPLLYDDNFKCEIDKVQEVVSNLTGQPMPDVSNIKRKSLDELKKGMDADTKYLDEILAKYGKIILDSAPSDCFKVAGADDTTSIYSWKSGNRMRAMEFENCRLVEIELAQKDMFKIADKVLEEMQKDNKLLEFICKYQKDMSFMQGYVYGYGYNMTDSDNKVTQEDIQALKDNLVSERDNLQYTFDPESDSIVMTMNVIADSKNNIISREITTDDGSALLANYIDKKGNTIKEFNFFEGDSEPFTLYLYDGKEGKGITVFQYGDSVEASYLRSDEGKNDIGLDYGKYKVNVKTSYESYEGVLTVNKNDSSKGAENLTLLLNQNGAEIVGLNINIKDLKDKSNLKFDKKGAIDLAEVDENELQEIEGEIGRNFQGIAMQIQGMVQ